MVPRRAALVAALSLAAALPVRGEWTVMQYTFSSEASTGPLVTTDAFDVTHVIWEEAGVVLHQDGPVPEVIGTGTDLDQSTCLMCNEVYVVWIDPTGQVAFRSWKSDLWHDVDVVGAAGLGTPRSPRVAKAGGPRAVWLEVDEGAEEYYILYAELDTGVWTPPLSLAGPLPYLAGEPPTVDITPIDAEDHLLVAWTGAVEGAHGRVFDGTTWLPAELLVSGAGGRIALDVDNHTWTTLLAAHAIQPVCPCNDVLVATGTGGVFGPAETIGTGHTGAAFEWPHDLALDVTVEGDPLVVWRHESYDDERTLVSEHLVLARRDAGGWTFDTSLAAGRNAQEPSVTTTFIGDATVAWCDDTDGSSNIYLASESEVVSVDGAPVAPSRILSVVPNPTVGPLRVQLGGSALGSGEVAGGQIVDITGRTVARLGSSLDGGLSWDGRDLEGRAVPAGVYVMMIGEGPSQESRRIVVTR